MAETKAIATEGGHWYLPDGKPFYTVKAKGNGEERAATLRDARKVGAFPSVTEILKMLPKPGLDAWKQKQVLLAALTCPSQQDGESHDDYCTRIMSDAQEQALKAREKGTAIHGAIENYIIGGPSPDDDMVVYISNSLDKLGLHIGDWGFLDACQPEKSFAHGSGYGGKVDLHSKSLNFVCDFKTSEFDENKTKLAWDEHFYQLVAYAHGLGMPDARLINVFISTSVPGLVRVHEHAGDREHAWNVFKSALHLWKTIKKYDCGYSWAKRFRADWW